LRLYGPDPQHENAGYLITIKDTGDFFGTIGIGSGCRSLVMVKAKSVRCLGRITPHWRKAGAAKNLNLVDALDKKPRFSIWLRVKGFISLVREIIIGRGAQ
jgi:hypothetical protein